MGGKEYTIQLGKACPDVSNASSAIAWPFKHVGKVLQLSQSCSDEQTPGEYLFTEIFHGYLSCPSKTPICRGTSFMLPLYFWRVRLSVSGGVTRRFEHVELLAGSLAKKIGSRFLVLPCRLAKQ